MKTIDVTQYRELRGWVSFGGWFFFWEGGGRGGGGLGLFFVVFFVFPYIWGWVFLVGS